MVIEDLINFKRVGGFFEWTVIMGLEIGIGLGIGIGVAVG